MTTPRDSAQFQVGRSHPGPTVAGDEDRENGVLVIEIEDVTVADWEAVVTAVKGCLVPLHVTSKVRLHAAIKDVAERVMEAFDGTV